MPNYRINDDEEGTAVAVDTRRRGRARSVTRSSIRSRSQSARRKPSVDVINSTIFTQQQHPPRRAKSASRTGARSIGRTSSAIPSSINFNDSLHSNNNRRHSSFHHRSSKRRESTGLLQRRGSTRRGPQAISMLITNMSEITSQSSINSNESDGIIQRQQQEKCNIHTQVRLRSGRCPLCTAAGKVKLRRSNSKGNFLDDSNRTLDDKEDDGNAQRQQQQQQQQQPISIKLRRSNTGASSDRKKQHDVDAPIQKSPIEKEEEEVNTDTPPLSDDEGDIISEENNNDDDDYVDTAGDIMDEEDRDIVPPIAKETRKSPIISHHHNDKVSDDNDEEEDHVEEVWNDFDHLNNPSSSSPDFVQEVDTAACDKTNNTSGNVEEVSLDDRWANALRSISQRLATQKQNEEVEEEEQSEEEDQSDVNNDGEQFSSYPIEVEAESSIDGGNIQDNNVGEQSFAEEKGGKLAPALTELQQLLQDLGKVTYNNDAAENKKVDPGDDNDLDDNGDSDDDDDISKSSFAADNTQNVTKKQTFAEVKQQLPLLAQSQSSSMNYIDSGTKVHLPHHSGEVASTASDSRGSASSESSVTLSVASGYTMESYNSLAAPPQQQQQQQQQQLASSKITYTLDRSSRSDPVTLDRSSRSDPTTHYTSPKTSIYNSDVSPNCVTDIISELHKSPKEEEDEAQQIEEEVVDEDDEEGDDEDFELSSSCLTYHKEPPKKAPAPIRLEDMDNKSIKSNISSKAQGRKLAAPIINKSNIDSSKTVDSSTATLYSSAATAGSWRGRGRSMKPVAGEDNNAMPTLSKGILNSTRKSRSRQPSFFSALVNSARISRSRSRSRRRRSSNSRSKSRSKSRTRKNNNVKADSAEVESTGQNKSNDANGSGDEQQKLKQSLRSALSDEAVSELKNSTLSDEAASELKNSNNSVLSDEAVRELRNSMTSALSDEAVAELKKSTNSTSSNEAVAIPLHTPLSEEEAQLQLQTMITALSDEGVKAPYAVPADEGKTQQRFHSKKAKPMSEISVASAPEQPKAEPHQPISVTEIRGPFTHPIYKLGDEGRKEDMIIFPKPKSRRGRRRGRRKKKRGSNSDSSSSSSDSNDYSDQSSRRHAHQVDIPLAIGQLRHLDAAFVRRSDGGWTYALVADGNHKEIRFVVSSTGSTKSIPTEQWKTCIRRIKVLSIRKGDRMFYNEGRTKHSGRILGRSRSFRGKGKGRFVSPSPTRRSAGVLSVPRTILENKQYN